MSTEWTPESLFYRQVHPTHQADGVPNSMAFCPTPKDDNKLSVDDASKASAEQSWLHFTTILGFQSEGAWALSAGEVKEAQDLKLEPSPSVHKDDPAKNNPAHCHIDFSEVSSKGQKKRRAQHLAIKATARGCQFRP